MHICYKYSLYSYGDKYRSIMILYYHEFISLTSIDFVRYKPQQFNHPMCSQVVKRMRRMWWFLLMCFVYPQTTPHVLLVFIKRRLKDLTIHVGLACIPFLRILCRWFLPDYYENNQWSVVSWELLPLFCII